MGVTSKKVYVETCSSLIPPPPSSASLGTQCAGCWAAGGASGWTPASTPRGKNRLRQAQAECFSRTCGRLIFDSDNLVFVLGWRTHLETTLGSLTGAMAPGGAQSVRRGAHTWSARWWCEFLSAGYVVLRVTNRNEIAKTRFRSAHKTRFRPVVINVVKTTPPRAARAGRGGLPPK